MCGWVVGWRRCLGNCTDVADIISIWKMICNEDEPRVTICFPITYISTNVSRHGHRVPGWGLLTQFPPFHYFPNFSVSLKHVLLLNITFIFCGCDRSSAAERGFSNPHPWLVSRHHVDWSGIPSSSRQLGTDGFQNGNLSFQCYFMEIKFRLVLWCVYKWNTENIKIIFIGVKWPTWWENGIHIITHL